MKNCERIIKGYYVTAILDDDENTKPHQVSRVYQCMDAAQHLASLPRSQLARPDSVNVCTRYGHDNADGICG